MEDASPHSCHKSEVTKRDQNFRDGDAFYASPSLKLHNAYPPPWQKKLIRIGIFGIGDASLHSSHGTED